MASARTERRPELDGLRALAVLSVVLAHTAENAKGPLAVAVGDIGSRGVDLFFVLSGCCLAYPLLAGRADGRTSWPSPAEFLRHRIARIAPPYYVTLLIFGLLAFTPFGLPTWPYAIPTTAVLLRQLGMDAAFLTSVYPFHNADYWTLGIEMRWYLLFPLVFALYVRSRAAFGIAMIVSVLLYRSPVSTTDFGMLPCFMLGIVAADIAVREVPWRSVVWPTSIVIFGAASWLDLQTPDVVDHTESIWQLAAFLIVVGVMGNRRLASIFSFRAFTAIGIASYSIYLVHHPIVDALARLGLPLVVDAWLAVGCGFVFWRCVEVPLLRRAVRRKIEDALRPSAFLRRRKKSDAALIDSSAVRT